MSDNHITVMPDPLKQTVQQIFHKAGCCEEDAAFIAQCLVQTNLWGIDSHGVLRVPLYIQRLQTGAMNPRPKITTVNGQSSLEVMDADNAPGYLAGRAAMTRAIELAKSNSIGATAIVNSNHCGATALYARMAAAQDMVGIAMSNVVPNMVVPGGSKPITGNNPIAMAVPTFDAFPFVLDISLSAVAGGKLLLAANNNEKIPLDWATDSEGRPTDDPVRGFEGFLLPMGGHKGFGLSLFVDILCGVITGGAFQHQLKGMYKYPDDPSLTSHMMIVLNPLAIMAKDELRERMASFYQTVKSSPMWDPSKEMFLPGEIEYRAEQERRVKGIPLAVKLYDELLELGAQLGVANPLPTPTPDSQV